ncbi:MAG: superoxide dismutase family protein [Candidatus Caldipriscus sp.]|jgi:Cu/Zn superoxide dismutase
MKDRAYIRGFKEKIVGEEKTYAIHIHEFGDCSSPSASGGHFDPYFSGRHGKK